MQRIILAALLAAVAVPAWAYNEERWQPIEIHTLNEKAFDVCRGLGVPSSVCVMKNASEDEALAVALSVLKSCRDHDTVMSARSAGCPTELAYIKQRWGY